MNLPTDFHNSIQRVFYDKSIQLLDTQTSTDDEGFAQTGYKVLGEFKGNVRFDSLDKLQLDYGLADKIDLSITTNQAVKDGQVLQYNGLAYEVSRAIQFDSHYLLVCKLCSRSKSTT